MKKRNLIRLSICFLIFFLAVLAFVLLDFTKNLDNSINLFFSSLNSSFLISSAKIISTITSTSILAAVLILIGFYHWLRKEKHDALFMISTTIFGSGLVYVLKEIIARARPLNAIVEKADLSFPSGHAAVSVLFFGILSYIVFRKIKSESIKISAIAVSIAAILIISISRLILNVHWFTDVLGGLFLGIFVFSLSVLLRKML